MIPRWATYSSAAPLAVAALVWAAPADAQAAGGELLIRLSSPTAEVQQPVLVTVNATLDSDSGDPSTPILTVPSGFTVQGPQISTGMQFSFGTGRQSRRSTTVTATFRVVGTKPGTYSIGPASMTVGGKRLVGTPVSLQLVAQGTLPTPRRGRRSPFPFDFDPFDPFGSMRMPRLPTLPPGFDEPDEGATELPPYPEDMAREKALDPVAFLYASAAPRRVVVGEQVTLQVYAYGSRGRFDVGHATDPSRPDFLTHNLDDDDYRPSLYQVPIGNEIWLAAAVRHLALFPIKAGRLEIGPMTMGFTGQRYASRRSPKGLLRESQPIFIEVVDPPIQGRPPGYRMGDVGRYTVSAKVEPREVTAGSAVSVVVELRGKGFLPTSLATPEAVGAEWLEPTMTSSLSIDGGKLGGSRKFRYVVRLQKAGVIDLGMLELPYFDPERNRYAVAKAKLGTVRVNPSPRSDGVVEDGETKEDEVSPLLAPRGELGPVSAGERYFAENRGFWWLILGLPLGVTALRSATAVARLLQRKRDDRRGSQSQLAKAALREAEEALVRSDRAAAASAVERCLCAATEDATGLKIRGVLRQELVRSLEERGLQTSLAERIRDTLDKLDDLRFAGDDVGLRPLLDGVRELLGLLRRAGREKGRRP